MLEIFSEEFRINYLLKSIYFIRIVVKGKNLEDQDVRDIRLGFSLKGLIVVLDRMLIIKQDSFMIKQR